MCFCCEILFFEFIHTVHVYVTFVGHVFGYQMHQHCLPLQAIVSCLCEPEVAQTEHVPLLRELLTGVAMVTEIGAQLSSQLSFSLFIVTLRVEASRHAPTLKSEVSNSVLILCHWAKCEQAPTLALPT